MVGDVFQQAFRNRLLDQNAEFDIPRPRPPPPPEPQQQRQQRNDPIGEIVNGLFDRLFRQLR
jgi:penicillin-binding protein 1A